MVHIKRIVIKNFKSFNGTLRLNFQPGFNVITGPNGSGKSNIIDAIQFVFGELGSRRMRVSDLSGLIFDGVDENGSRRALTAQVTLYFDNSDRGIAVDKSTVSVGRKVDRKGRSRYLLNGRRTSRRTVLDLLEMAGITPGGYNIVLQGTATRLTDLTPSERMTALESLIGITEYDDKKAEAKVRLTEAERKIEVASARIDEVRKRVNELERQRNDALRHHLLQGEEKRLNAITLSHDIHQLESKIEELQVQLAAREEEAAALGMERTQLSEERNSARARLEDFNREAAERGNTRLPILKSDVVGKRTLKSSLDSKLREIDSRKHTIQKGIESKLSDIDELELERDERLQSLHELEQSESRITSEIEGKESQIRALDNKIRSLRESAEANQRMVENLTGQLVPMQEILSGLEIESSRHSVEVDGLRIRIEELEEKKAETAEAMESLREKLRQFEALKAGEAKKLEDMLKTIEEQVKRQKSLRSTIESANKLAKEAETTITQFSAKRDIWKRITVEEKAQERIREMGETGALPGYHGPLRSLLKIDLRYQRAAATSSGGWITAIVVDDLMTVIECMERLKKTRLGMTRFLPFSNIKPLEPLPELEGEGIIGLMPNIIRYNNRYAPIVNLIWGDTLLVEDRAAALKILGKGYRAVTLSGDVYEVEGGILGGYYRRPPNFSKLIPSEDSVEALSGTIKELRRRLQRRMGDLKLSGGAMRKFTSYLEQSNKTIDDIDEQVSETEESLKRLERKIAAVDENVEKLRQELEREKGLRETLQGRREKTLQEIERTKASIADLRELSKPSVVTGLELQLNGISREAAAMRDRRAQLSTDISVQTNLISHYLELKIREAREQVRKWRDELESLDGEHDETRERLKDVSVDIEELQKCLDEVTSEVEATTQIMEQHQKTLRQINQKIERIDERREGLSHQMIGVNVELERLRVQREQKAEEMAKLGFDYKLSVEEVEIAEIESALRRVKSEMTSLGAINQLALMHYAEVVGNYKQLSVRINELEEEKASILRFIDEVEQEKQAHFMSAFNKVCENFSSLFSRLTGGGDGRLELQKPEDPFSAGVDLYVQFPGKPMRLASGASGGERSVAATAYLLAIQRFLKAPFYLLDEIDAHLDDMNISRLADVLRDNALESQFVVVTLKDVMVHNAERIYGVFAQGGQSRVLSLPMKVEVTL